MRATARPVRRPFRKLSPKAVETLCRDWERMVTFYRFPKDHRIRLRTTKVVELPFSAVRLRTDAARRYEKFAEADALIWKILLDRGEEIPPPQCP